MLIESDDSMAREDKDGSEVEMGDMQRVLLRVIWVSRKCEKHTPDWQTVC
jgi:hypothetical protein